jgi:hypothetical protein
VTDPNWNPKRVGDLSVARILARLIGAGHTVCMPFGDNARYDLICDIDGRLLRVQCKTGRLATGAIVFPVSSSATHRGRGRRGYAGEVDAFGVYCPQTDQTLLVPACDLASCKREVRLRVAAARNGQACRIRPAAMYEDFSHWPPEALPSEHCTRTTRARVASGDDSMI